MDETTAKTLRSPFPPEAVGLLPRVTCKPCSDSRARHCDQHRRQKCRECGNYVTTAHIHLSYVGHAAVTDRLLAADPGWTWEPCAFGPDGLPVLDRNGGLWIRLTVADVTRLGYGHADGKTGADAVKEAIGDALRNAAMRFGVALDLWHKDGNLIADDDTNAAGSGPAPRDNQPPAQRGSARQAPAEPAVESPAEARGRLAAACHDNGWDIDVVAARYQAQYGEPLGEASDANRIEAFRKLLYGVSDAELKAPASNGAHA